MWKNEIKYCSMKRQLQLRRNGKVNNNYNENIDSNRRENIEHRTSIKNY